MKAHLATRISRVYSILCKQHICQWLIVYLLLHHRGCEHHFSPWHRGRNQLCSIEVPAAVAGLMPVSGCAKAAFSAVADIDWGVKCAAAAVDTGGGRGGSGLGAVRAVNGWCCDHPAGQNRRHSTW